MTETPENLVLEHLRYIRKSVDELRDDLREVKLRLIHVEENLAMANRSADGVESRSERTERRLELVNV
jgi:hypothetical protein